MIEEFIRQKLEHQRTLSLDTSTTSQQSSLSSSHNYPQSTVEFSILCENLADHGHLSVQTDLASAFYCMLINCNENKLYMKNNSKRDDLFIQERPLLINVIFQHFLIHIQVAQIFLLRHLLLINRTSVYVYVYVILLVFWFL